MRGGGAVRGARAVGGCDLAGIIVLSVGAVAARGRRPMLTRCWFGEAIVAAVIISKDRCVRGGGGSSGVRAGYGIGTGFPVADMRSVACAQLLICSRDEEILR